MKISLVKVHKLVIFVGKRIIAMTMCLNDQTNNCLIHFYKRCVSTKSYNCSGLETVHKIKMSTNCHPTYVNLQYRVRGDRDLCNINYINKPLLRSLKKYQKVPTLAIRISVYCRTCNNLCKMTKLYNCLIHFYKRCVSTLIWQC